MSNDAGHTNEDLFRLYGIEPNKRTSGRLELELRCRIRRLRLLLSVLRARPTISWRRRLAAWRQGFTANSAVLYRLDETEPRDYLSDWAYSLQSYRFNGFFNPIIGNKLVLSQILSGQGIPHPQVIGVIVNGRLHHVGSRTIGCSADNHAALLDYCVAFGRPLVFRPHWSGGGEGIFFLQRSEGAWRVNGHKASDDDVLRLIGGLTRYIVTTFVEQAAYAGRIYPQTANTLRILSLIDEQGPFVAAVVHRFGTARSFPLDNWHQGRGGLCAEVDCDRSVLGRAVSLDDRGRLSWHRTHPQTQEPIEGVAIPGLAQALEGVLDAACCFPEALMVGWDILLTDDGFSIIEANAPPGIPVWQVHRPLLAEPRAARFFSRYGFHQKQ